MAKTPKGGLSDEEIVRLRDDAAYTDRLVSLGVPGARRALAESRLRALAIALSGTVAAQPHPAVPGDDELLEYLLADMPDYRRRELESRLRGSPLAFERLVKLHELTSAHLNRRDLHHVELAERQIERHSLGNFEVMSRAGRLAFRRMDEWSWDRSQDFSVSALALETLEPLAFADEEVEEEDTLDRVERQLHRCNQLMARLRESRGEYGGNKSPGIDGRRDDLSEYKRPLPAEEEFAESVRQLQDLALGLAREAVIARKLSPRPKFPSRGMSASSVSFSAPPSIKRRSFVPISDALESRWGAGWQERVDLTAGPWTLSFAGRSGAVPNLEVSVLPNGAPMQAELPFLTVVQPGKTFETADLASHGSAVLPLIGSKAILMLQAAAVWSVHFELHSPE
jgi:hypothetical protein